MSVTASTVIKAPPAQVWQTVWDPATGPRAGGHCLVAGHVPGTPVRQIGEIQYSVDRHTAGSLHPYLMVVHECVEGQLALYQTLPHETEMLCQFEPVAEGTRLTMTWSWSGRRVADMADVGRRLTDHVVSYKSLIEEQTSDNPSSGV